MSTKPSMSNHMDLAMTPTHGVSNLFDMQTVHDDEGHLKRTGTVWSASARITTALVGSAGVLSLAWAFAQLGWVLGPTVLCIFSSLTLCTSHLLVACYRDPVSGKRHYSYVEAVRAYLGRVSAIICETILYTNLFGIVVGFAASTSMLAIERLKCKNACDISYYLYMIAFAASEILLSQLPRFNEISWLPICATFMSLTYSSITTALGIAKVAETDKLRGSLSGIGIGPFAKLWRSFQGVGAIASAFFFSPLILFEIQDTLKSPPSESKTMKKAIHISVGVATFFSMLCACLGYAAFGELSPENLLSGSGYSNPFWLIDIANGAIMIHRIIAYQYYCRPIFVFVEKHAAQYFPGSNFINKEYRISLPGDYMDYELNLFRLTWRTLFVIITTIVSMLTPSVNDLVGIIEAIRFWTIRIYFPVKMYVAQNEIRRWSTEWMALQALIVGGLFVSIVVAAGSLAGIIT